MDREPDLTRVALAVSAFRSDASVIELLRKVFAGGASPFGAVIVVDSLGSGTIADTIGSERWPVNYHNSEFNLGSAGNLARRLELAAATGLDWCFAVNHDGVVQPNLIRALLQRTETLERVGAVYPKLIYTTANRKEDRARMAFSPFARMDAQRFSGIASLDVTWSSSNCALYNLIPTREGVLVWADLWMGWEDLGYGWQLTNAGWRQILCIDQFVDDSYEYRQVSFLGRPIYIADKPAWYTYYQLRNLVLIRRRAGPNGCGWGNIAMRAVIECAITLLYRRERRRRLGLLFRGLIDGLRGLAGKGPVP